MSEVKLPFGVAADGSMVSIDSVMRGKACECRCPECSKPLVACKGEIVRHYFRHHTESGCQHANETAIHRYAKQIICQTLQLALPAVELEEVMLCDLGKMISAQEEVRLGPVRPDVLAQYRSETVAIEIWVAHSAIHKIDHYARTDQTAIEIDLRAYRHADLTEEDWKKAVLSEAAREWMVPPARIRAYRDREKLRQIQELEEK